MVAKLIAVNVGLPRNVAWNGRTVYTGVWKAPVDGPRMGTRIPALTRQNAGLSAVSFRLIPIQYRSLPADSLQPESLLVQKPRNTPQAPTGFYGAYTHTPHQHHHRPTRRDGRDGDRLNRSVLTSTLRSDLADRTTAGA